MLMELGRMMAESIMYIDRKEIAGPDYKPFNPRVQKLASQPGSVYIGDQKIRVEHPRLRGRDGEIQLKSYERLNGTCQENCVYEENLALNICLSS